MMRSARPLRGASDLNSADCYGPMFTSRLGLEVLITELPSPNGLSWAQLTVTEVFLLEAIHCCSAYFIDGGQVRLSVKIPFECGFLETFSV